MIQKRDLLVGIALVATVLGIAVLALFMLSVASLEEPHIREPSVAILDITGGIYAPAGTVKQLERYISHENVSAIVIRLNTPGGGVAATQEIYETVRKAKDAGKVVIASLGTVAASGGYYIAAACDTIMANPATITGSIGVIATFPDLSGLYEKVGIDITVVKTGEFKDTGSTARGLTEHERAYLDEVLEDMFDQFLGVVASGRGMSLEEVRNLADGRVFTGRQAVANGLIDILGTFQDAIDLAGELAGLGVNPPVYREKQTGVRDILFEGMSGALRQFSEQRLPMMSYLMDF
ncbi:signal peptide peptidase SppA [Candidatus Latescibacterota bacterium]